MRLLRGPQIRLVGDEAGEKFLCVFIAHRCCDDDIIALFPIYRSRDLVFGGQLHGFDGTEYFIEITSEMSTTGRRRLRIMVKLAARTQSTPEESA